MRSYDEKKEKKGDRLLFPGKSSLYLLLQRAAALETAGYFSAGNACFSTQERRLYKTAFR